ncbi:hypothetical protein QFC19_002331 [Naganishia cerealis]|uniref:Uncharacterized protein n=1 Tax=Naganishia cerealis TaxID=610337 RepID=A0ACC2WAY6_9TREE|nr:hypothetical protein QFC19_002331 [Naganishia cerealis]
MAFDTLASPYTAIAALAATCIFLGLLQSSGRRNSVPWAKTSIPFLGGAIQYGTDPVKFLIEQRRKVGDVFRVNLVVMKITFVLGAKWNRWLLKDTKEEEVSFWDAILAMHCGLIDTSFYHPGWLDRSVKALSNALNRPARVEQYSESFVQVASDIYSTWASQPSIPLFISGSELLLRANMTALYGPSFVDRYATELIPVVRSFERAFVQPLTRVLPLWASPSGRVLLRAYKRMKQVIESEVNMRMKNLDQWQKEDDYLSYLLTMDDKAEDFFECYGEHLMTMISASHVNTAATFSWTLLHLLRNPSLLAEFEKEIKANPPITGSYPIKNMPFSEACLRETGRLYTNLLMLRYVAHDVTTPQGVIIPKGWVAGSPLATQQDPELYDQPGKWDPHRFLSDASSASSYSSKFRNNEFVQFGYGKHACLGEKMTHALLRASLWPELVDNYHLEVVDGLVDGEGIDGVGVKPNYRENMGTPFGVREVNIRVTKRDVRLSDQNVE